MSNLFVFKQIIKFPQLLNNFVALNRAEVIIAYQTLLSSFAINSQFLMTV